MAGTKNVHYEILGRRGADWTILGVVPKREDAIEKAEGLWGGGAYTGIRILKESFDKLSQEITTIEIFSRGATRKKSKYDETGTLSPCLTPDDLYSSDGRRSIWDLFHSTLESWAITPMELLYSPKHYHRLNDTGTLIQNAVQRVAISIEGDGDSVQERMRKLYTVIDLAVGIMSTEEDNIPSLEMGRLKPLVAALEEKPNKVFLLTASLVEYLRPADTIVDKFGRIAILPKDTRPEWVSTILDQLIAEFILHRRLITYLLDDEDNKDRGDFMLRLVYLQAGKIEEYIEENAPNKVPGDAIRLSLLLGQGLLPQTKKNIINILKADISASRPVNTSGLVAQLKALRKLMDAVTSMISDISHVDELEEEVKSRAGRLINSQGIGELLYDIRDPFEQMYMLIDMEGLAIGNSNKRTIANFMLPIMSRPDYEAIFLGMDSNPLECLKKLVSLQGRIMATDLTEMHKRKIAEKLDSFGSVILNNAQILKKIHELNLPIQEKTKKLLTMLADGYFPEGDSRKKAESQARLYMKQPGFTEGLVKDLGRGEQEKALLDFRELLARANIS